MRCLHCCSPVQLQAPSTAVLRRRSQANDDQGGKGCFGGDIPPSEPSQAGDKCPTDPKVKAVTRRLQRIFIVTLEANAAGKIMKRWQSDMAALAGADRSGRRASRVCRDREGLETGFRPTTHWLCIPQHLVVLHPAQPVATGYPWPVPEESFSQGSRREWADPQLVGARGSCEKLSSVDSSAREPPPFPGRWVFTVWQLYPGKQEREHEDEFLELFDHMFVFEGLASGSDHRIREIGSYSRLSCRNVEKARFAKFSSPAVSTGPVRSAPKPGR